MLTEQEKIEIIGLINSRLYAINETMKCFKSKESEDFLYYEAKKQILNQILKKLNTMDVSITQDLENRIAHAEFENTKISMCELRKKRIIVFKRLFPLSEINALRETMIDIPNYFESVEKTDEGYMTKKTIVLSPEVIEILGKLNDFLL